MGLSWNVTTGGPVGSPPPPLASRRTAVVLAVAFVAGALLAAFAAARPATVLAHCVCGHDARAHEHNRPGTWCAQCPRFGDEVCARYVPVSRPSWSDDPPRLPTDAEDRAASFLRALALAARTGPASAVP